MTGPAGPPELGWGGIVRLGCVQAALGAIVVLATSTMNRVMVVELSLPAILPALLIALQYAVQVLRPALGHGSDEGGRRTPWIRGGMALLGAGALLAAVAIARLQQHPGLGGIALAVLAFAAIGIGVGSSGTALLALLSQRVAPHRRPAAASAVWIMMIAGIALTASLAGHWLQPFSAHRLLRVTACVAMLAQAVTLLATWGVEHDATTPDTARLPAPRAASLAPPARMPFRAALGQVWADPQARRFTGFVGVSMLAYSAQELVLEPFAGAAFRMSPGGTAELTGLQHGGALIGMLLVALLGGGRAGGRQLGVRLRSRLGTSLRYWTLGGCAACAASLAAMALSGVLGQSWLLHGAVFALGLGNGTFAVAAIGAMMQLSAGGNRQGVRIGLWGAAQALAFALGGLLGAGASDVARTLIATPGLAYAPVLLGEAALFLLAARQAARIFPAPNRMQANPIAGHGAIA